MKTRYAELNVVTFLTRLLMFGVQDDRRYGCADGIRELRDKGECVGAGREVESFGHQGHVRWSSILVHRPEGVVHTPLLSLSQVPNLEFSFLYSRMRT